MTPAQFWNEISFGKSYKSSYLAQLHELYPFQTTQYRMNPYFTLLPQ